MVNILQVTPFDTYPPQTGSEQRAHGLVSAFPKQGDEVRRFSQLYRKSTIRKGDLRRIVPISDNYSEYRARSPVYELSRTLTSYGLDMNSMMYIGDVLARHQTETLKKLNRWADLVLVRDKYQVKGISEISNVPVVFSNHRLVKHQHGDYRANSSRLLNLVGKEPRGMKEIEEHAVQSADAIICHSEHEKEGLIEDYNPEVPIIIAPAAIPSKNMKDEDISKPVRLDIDSEFVGIYIGAGTHNHNIEAAKASVNIVESVNQMGYDTHLLLVGNIGDHVETQGRQHVSELGFVDELKQYLDMADFALNPTKGEGVNVKMLDYFARGLPVVTTKCGASGYHLVDGKEVIISELDDMALALGGLLEDECKRESIGQASKNFVERNHTWSTVSQQLRQDLIGENLI